MKKTILALLILLAAALLFTGCGGNEPNNPVTPPEPETLEGEWLGELTVPAGSLLGNTVQMQAVYAKAVISGNNYTMYMVDDAYIYNITVWYNSSSTNPKPAPSFNSAIQDQGTISVEGNVVTITSTMISGFSNTGALSEDFKSFVMLTELPQVNRHTPMVAEFKKQ